MLCYRPTNGTDKYTCATCALSLLHRVNGVLQLRRLQTKVLRSSSVLRLVEPVLPPTAPVPVPPLTTRSSTSTASPALPVPPLRPARFPLPLPPAPSARPPTAARAAAYVAVQRHRSVRQALRWKLSLMKQ